MKGNNDNLDPWTSIGLQTNLILNRLRCQTQLRELTSEEKKGEKPSENHDPGDNDQRRDAEHEKYVVARLREIRAFEDRARGIKKRGR
jgi:hypothetical protein